MPWSSFCSNSAKLLASYVQHILEFCEPPTAEKSQQRKYSMIYNEGDLRDTIRKIEEGDADADVFTMMAYD
jgi:hypothetical protein